MAESDERIRTREGENDEKGERIERVVRDECEGCG